MRIAVLALVVASACTLAAPPPSASPEPTTTAAARLARMDLGNGLVLDAPFAWQQAGRAIVNRATQRLAMVGNGDLATLPTLPGNGDVDAAALPSGRVIVEIESFCRLTCAGPEAESDLPLDWSEAKPLRATALPPGHHELALGFRWFDEPLFVVARWRDDALAADIAAIADIARSVRPDPPPRAGGEYRGWAGIGALSAIPVGSVRTEPLPPGARAQVAGGVYSDGPLFIVRGKQRVYVFVSRPLVDPRCEIRYDDVADRFRCAIDGRSYEWSRFGRYLGPDPQSDLPQHRAIVRAGDVWVRYGESSLLVPSVADEAAER